MTVKRTLCFCVLRESGDQLALHQERAHIMPLVFTPYEPTRRRTTIIIDDTLVANRAYAKNYDPKMGKPPAPKIAVVT